MKIKLLPDQVINQISAGEVVERPSSVVRELLDNAIDAGATDILVHIEAGGKSLIKVSDDGCGMDRDDAVLAFERHATSKIREASELTGINTFGFRGEALPSIAAVSKVSLKTRPKDSELGTEVVFEGGRLISVNSTGGNPGTEISVRSLFYNTPARRNFLKTTRTEELKIKNWVLNFALIHPAVRFRLFVDQKEELNLPRRESANDRAASLLGEGPLEIKSSRNGFAVEGLLSAPGKARCDISGLVFYVNKRLVSDKLMFRAVKEGFDSMLKEREVPAGFIALTLPPELVDVNVHPQKSEVRFRAPQDVFLTVRNAVFESVRSHRRPEQAEQVQSRDVPVGTIGYSGSAALFDLSLNEKKVSYQENFLRPAASWEEAPRMESEFRYQDLRFVGQIFSCYLACTLDESFYLIDMHAAHERCNYNLIRSSLKESEKQLLLLPITVSLSEEGLQNCLENRDLLELYGFDIEPFSEKELLIRQIPALLAGADLKVLFEELSQAAEYELQGRVKQEFDRLVARLACHASIRSGYRIKEAEVYALFAAMDEAETAGACPHGRPVAVKYRKEEIERWFGRDR